MCTYIINLMPSLPISCSVYLHTIVRVLFRILSLGRGSYIKFPKKKMRYLFDAGRDTTSLLLGLPTIHFLTV